MTTYVDMEVTCGSCGNTFTHQELASCYTAGLSDLDTRPCEMKRSTMRSWIQCCPTCNYCADDASKFDERCREILMGDAYRNEMHSRGDKEKLSSLFTCAAMLYKASGDRTSAAWAHLRTAWIFDDAGETDLAHTHRNKAAELFLSILKEGGRFTSQDGGSEAIVTDVLRRAGRGDEAMQIINDSLAKNVHDFVKKVLIFEKTLIRNGDIDVHGLDEVTA